MAVPGAEQSILKVRENLQENGYGNIQAYNTLLEDRKNLKAEKVISQSFLKD